MTKRIVGRVDKIDLPQLNLFDVAVNIDTGAYTSAIHCSEIIDEKNSLRCTFESKGHPYFSSRDIVFKNSTLSGWPYSILSFDSDLFNHLLSSFSSRAVFSSIFFVTV